MIVPISCESSEGDFQFTLAFCCTMRNLVPIIGTSIQKLKGATRGIREVCLEIHYLRFIESYAFLRAIYLLPQL